MESLREVLLEGRTNLEDRSNSDFLLLGFDFTLAGGKFVGYVEVEIRMSLLDTYEVAGWGIYRAVLSLQSQVYPRYESD